MKKIIKWLGRVLMVLSLFIMAYKLWGYRDDIEIEMGFANLFQLGVCCLLYGIIVYLCPVIYKKMLYMTTSKDIRYTQIAYVYCKSNVLKYLPGNVMQYVGRNEIAVQEELPHGKVALATVFEIITTVLSSILVAVLFSWSYTVEWVNKFVDFDIKILISVAVAIILGGILVLAVFRKKLLKYIGEILTLKNIVIFLSMILYNSIIMALNSFLYFYVLSLLGIKMAGSHFLIGIGLYSLAFVLGYVTPGVPGGIGIRETVLVYFFSAFVQEAQMLTGAVIFRIVSVIGDFIGLGIAIVAGRVAKEEKGSEH